MIGDLSQEQRPAIEDLQQHQVMMARNFSDVCSIYDNNEAELRPPHWDGSPDLTNPQGSRQEAYQIYLQSSHRKTELEKANITEDISRPDLDSSDEDEELPVSNSRMMTRQEMKQLDREIPWREIMELPLMMRQKYVEAATKEYNGWMDWHGIKPLTNEEAQAVRNDPFLRRRVLKSRAAYRDKARGQGPLRAKARIVLIGCGDPDLRQLTRDSPTPTRLSEYILLSAAASGMNRMFNQDSCEWSVWISDAAQAFLQGRQDPTERKGPIYMEPPRDPILVEAGAYPAPLYEVEGNCYGLANAPRVWYNNVVAGMKKINFFQRSLDRCFFMHINEKKKVLDAMCIVHVDDFLTVYSEIFPLEAMEKLFKWGSITKIDLETSGEYRGKEISCVLDSKGKKTIKVTQKAFLQNLSEGKITRGRLAEGGPLTKDEWKEMRSACGCLQWLGGQTRPDLAATASVCNRGNDTEVSDLKKIHDALATAKASQDCGLCFPAVSFDCTTTIVTFSDSSWANAKNFSSQFGVLVLLCPAQVKDTTVAGHVIDWKTGRSPRICRSTLAAEAIAADEGADRSSFVNFFLTEVFTLKPSYKGNMTLQMVRIVDAKSLYDSLVAENPSLSEKRSLINVRSVQQVLAPNQIHWVPTGLMHADNLPKYDVKLQERMRIWLKNPTVQLRETASRGGDRTKTSEKTDAP